jgi:hypothetical protein
LPTTPHAIVAVGASGTSTVSPAQVSRASLPKGWSAISGEAAFLAASRSLLELPGEPDAQAAALVSWTVERIDKLRSFLPSIAGA